jgi:hypothetical protein
VLSKREAAEPIIEPGRIAFPGQSSALFYAGAPPTVKEQSSARIFQFARDGRFDWYAFSGGPFAAERVCEPPEGIIAFGFSDASGAYLALCNPLGSAWKGPVTITQPQRRALTLDLANQEVRVIALGDGS